MKTKPLLKVKGLGASFTNGETVKEVLHDISFELEAGRTLGIVGESGSGKSVTSLSIMRLIPSPPINYTSGELLYQDSDIDLLTMDADKIRSLRGNSIAMIFQEPMSSLNPLKRCGEQVSEALSIGTGLNSTERRAEVIRLFEKVKLPDPERAYTSYPHTLSGGQKQRVMIAMAISCQPKLLIADEPTTALDVTVQREIMELLHELQVDTGMAMIFISHDLAVVSHVAHELLVMHQGHIVESGPVAQVMHSPTHPYTIGLLNSRPPVDQRPKRLLTVADSLSGEELEPELISVQARAKAHAHMYEQTPLLVTEDIHTWYPQRAGVLNKVIGYVKAVNGVSITLHPGETLGVVGESGCGKSTLGRTIIGLEALHAGAIRYMGQNLAEMSPAERSLMKREVQMIFQDPYSSLDPRMSIGEAILEPMTVHGILATRSERMAEVHRLLKRVGLDESAFDRPPHAFSGGQRQRICIARTLALRPKVIICDESVSALDVSVQAQVLNLLNELKEEFGLSYIFISHDLSVVRYMSDRVVVMNSGQVLESGEADALYSEPQHDYTRSLIEATYTLN